MLSRDRISLTAVAWLWPWVLWLGLFAQPQDSRADSLRTRALTATDPKQASDRWLELSKHYRRSNLDSSQACLDRAMAAAARSGDTDRQQRCNMSQAAMNWMQGKLDAAEEGYRRAVAYWQAKGDSLEVARCLLNLGTVFQAAHKDAQAANSLKTALRLAQALGEQLIAAQAAGSIATVSFQLGLPDSIGKYSEIAKQGFEALRDSANLTRVHCNLGFYYLGLGMSYEARQPYLDALRYVQGTQEVGLKGEVHDGIAGLEFRTGNYSQAIDHYLIARRYFTQLKWYRRIADNHNTIGICYKLLGRIRTAQQYFAEAYRLGDSLGNDGIAGAAMHQMALLEQDGDNCLKAMGLYRRSLQREAKAPEQPNHFQNLQGLGRCHMKLGQPDSARHYFSLAEEFAAGGKDSLLIAAGNLDLARLFLQDKRMDMAQPLIATALGVYTRQRNAPGLREAWILQGECSEAMGDVPAALKAERMARVWQDSMQVFTANTQLLALEARYWSEHKQHALEIAKQNEALKSMEAQRAKEASAKLAAERNLLIIALLLILLFGLGLYWINRKRRQTQLDRKLTELRLSALRAQMNPHFVFNALGSVQLLINTSAIREANLYLSKFAQLLRLTLERSDDRFSSLADELEALRLYIDLEALRFKFQYTITLADELDPEQIAFPTLLLQPLVENSVKHGIGAMPHIGLLQLRFSLDAGELCCIVEDNGQGRAATRKREDKPTGQGRRSMGLEITRERLSLLQPQRHDRLQFVDLLDTEGKPCGTRVVIRLPIIQL